MEKENIIKEKKTACAITKVLGLAAIALTAGGGCTLDLDKKDITKKFFVNEQGRVDTKYIFWITGMDLPSIEEYLMEILKRRSYAAGETIEEFNQSKILFKADYDSMYAKYFQEVARATDFGREKNKVARIRIDAQNQLLRSGAKKVEDMYR